MKTIVEILIDNSNSMGAFESDNNPRSYLLPDGSTRMSLAKKILVNEILPLIDDASLVVVRLFHSEEINGNTQPIVKKIFEGGFDQEFLSNIITKVPDPLDTGGTPITAAVLESIHSLAKYTNDDRKIILVTDGEETDGGDYKKTVEESFITHGIPISIFIIGIAQTEEAEKKSTDLAKMTGGSYVPLKTAVYTKDIEEKLRPLKKNILNSTIAAANLVGSISKPEVPPRGDSVPQISSITSTSVVTAAAGTNTNTNTSDGSSDVNKITLQQGQKSEDPNGVDEGRVNSTNEIINNRDVYDRMDRITDQLEKNNTIINALNKKIELVATEIEYLKIQKTHEKEFENIHMSENPELNEQVRIKSEQFLFEKLSAKYGNRVKWLNQDGESGSNHDFEVIDIFDDTIEYFIECKGTMNNDRIFYLTKNEWFLFLENSNNYQLFLIVNALIDPSLIKIDNFKEWLLRGKVVPCFSKNTYLKAERIPFTIM